MVSCSTTKPILQEKIKIPEIASFEMLIDSLNTSNQFQIQPVTKPAWACIIATGDIVLGTCIPNKSYLPHNYGVGLFSSDVRDILSEGDVTFGNLEGAICGNRGEPKKKKYVFAMPLLSAEILKKSGYNLLSTSNNHALDMGEVGKKQTQIALTKSGINYAGYEDVPVTIFQRKGVVYSFIAVSPVIGTVTFHNEEWLIKRIKELENEVDITILSMHIGAEGSKHQHINRKTEFFMKENRGNPYEFARKMIDAGADVILGHGPHVTRAIDIYKNRFIAYSLGNFCTVGRVRISGPSGIAPIIKIVTTNDGTFLFGKIYSTKQISAKGTLIDKRKRVIKKIQTLTAKDIPESGLVINDNGDIYKEE